MSHLLHDAWQNRVITDDSSLQIVGTLSIKSLHILETSLKVELIHATWAPYRISLLLIITDGRIWKLSRTFLYSHYLFQFCVLRAHLPIQTRILLFYIQLDNIRHIFFALHVYQVLDMRHWTVTCTSFYLDRPAFLCKSLKRGSYRMIIRIFKKFWTYWSLQTKKLTLNADIFIA